jgi:hypothetical protein
MINLTNVKLNKSDGGTEWEVVFCFGNNGELSLWVHGDMTPRNFLQQVLGFVTKLIDNYPMN